VKCVELLSEIPSKYQASSLIALKFSTLTAVNRFIGKMKVTDKVTDMTKISDDFNDCRKFLLDGSNILR
jgi:hypothetical protein